ncbi:hypothetical protein BKA61DRAFT_582125 [Leptodontidium sp. MPI-SDFR-AT-0119]|nr:hypothetical protein BKA61DRAFT_582125 [Leptodontidium sp. MPI-SDFR-AT-0119]
METLLAPDLAGAIFCFVTSAREIVSLGTERMKSSTAVVDAHLGYESMIQGISGAYDSIRLANSLNFDSRKHARLHDEALTRICEECHSLHDIFKDIVTELQVEGSTEKKEVLCATPKFVWRFGGHHGLEELDKRLLELELQIDEHIPSYIRSQKESTEKWVQELAEKSRRLNINRSKELQQLVVDTNNAFRDLSISPTASEHSEGNDNIVDRRRRPRSGTFGPGKSASDIIIAFSIIAKQARKYAAECHIVQSLASTRRKDRYQDDTVKGTSPASERPRYPSSISSPSLDHFNEWLENGTGIFWILGTTGTGKSTFMTQLSATTDTKDALLRWGGNLPVISASFGSEDPRTTTQYSIDDLFRSIFLYIIRQCPSLIAASSLKEWSYLGEARGRQFGDVAFRHEDLALALESLCRVHEFNAKFCFFIDGLDEHGGYNKGVGSLFKRLCSLPFIKMCVTGRPKDTIGDPPTNEPTQCILLPDLMDGYICHYIDKKLAENSWIEQQEPATYWRKDVFEYLRKESAGSFVWIDLAFSRALSDMKALDDMCDLLTKLKQLPINLQDLLLHILNDVQEEDRDQQARILLLASQAREPLSVLAFSFLGEESPDAVLARAAVPMGQPELDSRCEASKRQVLERSGCLVDVIPSSGTRSGELVVFSHSSVRDYIRSTEARQILTQRLKTPFDLQRELCNILLAQIKFHKVGPMWEEGGQIHELVLQFLHEAKVYELASSDVLGVHINELEAIVHQRKGQTFWWWQKRSIEKGESTSTFLELLIRYQLVGYLRWRFKNFPQLVPRVLEMANLLESALIPPAGTQINPELVRTFLDHGADPDYPTDHGHHLDAKPTPWRLFLLHLIQSTQRNDSTQLGPSQDRFLAIEHLINAGADLETPLCPATTNGSGSIAAKLSVEEVIRIVSSPEDASYLCRLVEQRRKQQNVSLSGWLGWR